MPTESPVSKSKQLLNQLEVRSTDTTAGVLTLSTANTTVTSSDILGQLNFKAPLEASAGDAILVSASIWAEATGTFDATTNTTDLVFATSESEAAVEKMRIASDGNVGIGIAPTVKLHVNGDVVVGDISGNTVHAQDFFSMAPYTDSTPASPSNNDTWFHSGATGTITLNYRTGGNNFSVELAP